MKKVLVLGCKGMAGHVIKTHLESLGIYEVWGLARDVKSKHILINLDVSDTQELEDILNKGDFDVIIEYTIPLSMDTIIDAIKHVKKNISINV